MFYKAGEKATALAIAKREDCFDQLAEESRKKDPEFHAYVLRAWTDRLIDTNQPLRALQVTDFLADEAIIDPKLLERRHAWIDMLFNEADEATLQPEVVARALLSAEWADEAEVLANFAVGLEQDQVNQPARALDAVTHWTRDDGDRLTELFDHLFRMTNLVSGAQKSFWKSAAPIVIERISLALISHSDGMLTQNQKDGLQSLLRKARAEVLATDLNKLKLQNNSYIPTRQKWTLPPPTMERPAASSGCLVGNDMILIWRESQLLQLLDPKGRVVWQGNVADVEALIPIGSGSDVLIVQKAENGKFVSRFSTSKRAFFTIGLIGLTTYHDITSEGQWLVQIAEKIGALDLVKLCAPQPEVEFLWSSNLTASVEVLSFLHQSGNPQWLTRDLSETRRHGILEAWSIQNGRTLQTWLINIESELPYRYLYWRNCYDVQPSVRDKVKVRTMIWTMDQESQSCALLEQQRQSLDVFDNEFLSCDRSRAVVIFNGNEVECTADSQLKRTMVLDSAKNGALRCLTRGTGPGVAKGHSGDRSDVLLFGVSDGRILLVNMKLQKVSIF
jgi:hypothetical protein